MIPRYIHEHIKHLLTQHPAVALIGARRLGKTTLARTFSDTCFDMEQDEDLTRLDIEWSRHMRGEGLVILDEIQHIPELFLRLRAIIDEQYGQNGRFLITESFASPLIKSLEGRVAVCELSPLLVHEMDLEAQDDLWVSGGYPENIGALEPFPSWQQRYLDHMVQRDLPNWGFPAPPRVTERLLKMLAMVHGQHWNASQISKSLGVTYHTVNAYVTFLENAGLVRRLPAAGLDLRKRLVKSPKFYWRDSGLLHALSGLTDEKDLYTQPWVGASWEGWVIEQIISRLQTTGLPLEAMHFGTSDRYTLHLLLEYREKRWAIDITISSHPEPEMLARLDQVARLAEADYAILVSRTGEPIEHEGVLSMDLSNTLEMLMG